MQQNCLVFIRMLSEETQHMLMGAEHLSRSHYVQGKLIKWDTEHLDGLKFNS